MYDRTKGLGWLLRDVSRLLRRRFNERARDSGLTEPQWLVLKELRREEGISQRMLAERVGVEPITLVKQLDRLELAGLVRRRRDPADRRTWRIYLAEPAHEVLGRMSGWAREIREACLEGFEGQEIAALRASLARLKANLEAAGPAGPPAAAKPAAGERDGPTDGAAAP